MPTGTGTVVADFVDGTLAQQAATVTLTPTAFRAVEEGMISPNPLTVPMVNGLGQLVVAATTADWKYRVDEVIGTVRRSYYIDVTAGATVQLKDVAHAVPPNPLVVPVKTVATIAPDFNGNIPTAALQSMLGTGDGAVPTSRQILTGAGLTGGGNLTADRTIAANIGTAAGTLAAGDDARIVGAIQQTVVDAKGDLLIATGPDTVTRLAVGSVGQVLTADPATATGQKWATPAPFKTRASTGLLTSGGGAPFGPAGVSGAWTLCPAAWRVTIPAAVGDVLEWLPAAIVGATSSDAELDLAAVVAGAPVRYASSGTGTQSPNGHGGLYVYSANGRKLGSPMTWVVAAGDIDGTTITLALMYRAAGAGITIGVTAYPSQIDVLNHGAPAV